MRNVLIIGGTSALGNALIKKFNKSHNVYYTYNRSNDITLETLCKKSFKVDITDETSIEKMAKDFEVSNIPIDILIYTSGIYQDSKVENMELEHWNKVISVNLTGAFLVSKYMIPFLKKSKSGRIINIGSVVGTTGGIGAANYASSKSALYGLTKTLALELAKSRITANVVELGYMDGGMGKRIPENVKEKVYKRIPFNTFGNLENASSMILHLSSIEADYITGQIIRVNGGLYM